MKVIIRAGGLGTRLWPYSRQKKPKQLFPLISKKSMLKETFKRAKLFTKPKNIYVSTSKPSAKATRKEVKAIPKKNLIIEPAARDTAAAIGLETLYIWKKNPQAIIFDFASDHIISKPKELKRIVKIAVSAVKKYPDHLLQIGIKPISPHTGYGYIELGTEMEKIHGETIYKIKSFKEKPDLATAKKFLESGLFLWNANLFVWRADTILNSFKKFQPQMYEQLMVISKALGTKKEQAVLSKIYPEITKIAIDYAILEKETKKLALAADIGWDDIGDWNSLAEKLDQDKNNNVVRGTNIAIDTNNCLIFGNKKKLMATVGLENLVIVDTDDALLICDKKRSQAVKDIVKKLQEENKNTYL